MLASEVVGIRGLATWSTKPEVVMDSQSLVIFILLPLVVVVLAVTFLIIQRARKKRDKLT